MIVLAALAMHASAWGATIRVHLFDRLGEGQLKDEVTITFVGQASTRIVRFQLERDNTEEFKSVTLPAPGEYLVQLQAETTFLENGQIQSRMGGGQMRIDLRGGELFEAAIENTNAPMSVTLRRLQTAVETPALELPPPLLPPLMPPEEPANPATPSIGQTGKLATRLQILQSTRREISASFKQPAPRIPCETLTLCDHFRGPPACQASLLSAFPAATRSPQWARSCRTIVPSVASASALKALNPPQTQLSLNR
ncbi:MAG: hypothetical protein ABMA26_19235 [Limisphaerales bacterium]